MKIPNNYRKPVFFAVLIHALILCALIFHFAPTFFRTLPSSAAKTIQATVISHAVPAIPAQDSALEKEQQWAARIQKVQAEKEQEQAQAQEAMQQKLAQEKVALAQQKQTLLLQQEKMATEKALQQKLLNQKIAQEKAAAQKAAQLKQQKIAQEKLAQEKLAQQKLHQAALAKALALKKKQEKIAKEKAAKFAQAKKLLAEQKKLQQELMQQQISSEEKSISNLQTQAQQQGKIDKYKGEILALIQSNWRIDQVNNKLKCEYSVSVAPDGSILSVNLVKSSGDPNLDDSAKQAILNSSPLPVPQSPILFAHFRQIVLTLSPQGFLMANN